MFYPVYSTQVLFRFHLVRRTHGCAIYSFIMKNKFQQNNETLCLRRSQLTAAFSLHAVSISVPFLRYLTKAFKGSKSFKKWTSHFLLASRERFYYCANVELFTVFGGFFCSLYLILTSKKNTLSKNKNKCA